MDHLINKIVSGIKDSLINHGFDWIITIVITYITVHLATKKYYNSVRKSTVRPCMEQGLKLILEKDIIPANAKSILVENKGIAIFRWKKYKCRHPFSLLRKTVCTVGGNENSTSEARPRFWAVLGLAYQLKSIVFMISNNIDYWFIVLILRSIFLSKRRMEIIRSITLEAK